MSILQRNLLNINILNTKSKVSSNNIFGSKQPVISFNKDIKSIDMRKYLFINKLNSVRSDLAKRIKQDQRRLATQQIDLDKEFEIKYILNQSNEQQKLDDILLNTIGKTVPVLSCVRLKTIGNEGLQYFVSDDYNGNHEVVLIDLYHLFMPSADRSIGEKRANPRKKYNEHKNDAYCLSKIIIDTQN